MSNLKLSICVICILLSLYDASAQQKQGESAQYLPPQEATTSAVWVGDEIIPESSLVVLPADIPADICDDQYRCLRRIYVKVELSTGGATGRVLKKADDYSADLNYSIRTYSSATFVKYSIPVTGEYELSVESVSGQSKSRASIVHDITAIAGNTCSIDDLFDLFKVSLYASTLTFSTATPQWVKDSLRLEISLIIDYSMHPFPLSTTAQLYHFNTTNGGIIPNVVRPTQANQMLFAWSYANCTPHMPLHQLQILRLYNTKDEYREDPEYCQANVDWNKAQNVYLYSTSPDQALSTKLTLTEGTGWYVWRVRPIGNLYEGGMANDSNYGVWSVAAEQDDAFNNGPGGLAIGSQTGITSGSSGTALSLYKASFFYEQF
ncbi:MAG TPA: hypothetical protein VK147_06865, partial [Candidatus Didemnitutus sp.]|nr:hypothetical protein [Candidatus Didemnitutus sp.]